MVMFCALGFITLLLKVGMLVCQEDIQDPEPGPDCTCLPIYLCINGTVNENGRGLLKAKGFGSKNVDDYEVLVKCGKFHVCCNKPNTEEEEQPNTEEEEQPNTEEEEQPNTEEEQPNTDEEQPNTDEEQPNTDEEQPNTEEEERTRKCGRRRLAIIRKSSPRQSSSTSNSTFGEWPWQGSLLLPGEGTNAIFQCAGVLIDDRFALTVAHCVSKFRKDKPPTLFLRLGFWDTLNLKNTVPFQDINIASIRIHPNYDGDTLINDIALLKLSEPVNFSPHVDTICLPYDEENHDDETCVVTGWGKESWRSSSYSRFLKQTPVPIVNHTHCQAKLRETRLGRFFKLHQNFMCAGGNENEDSCKGDGGGPLACQRADGTYALIGLVSWGVGCGDAGIPGVYINVKNYMEWIYSITKKPKEYYWPEVSTR